MATSGSADPLDSFGALLDNAGRLADPASSQAQLAVAAYKVKREILENPDLKDQLTDLEKAAWLDSLAEINLISQPHLWLAVENCYQQLLEVEKALLPPGTPFLVYHSGIEIGKRTSIIAGKSNGDGLALNLNPFRIGIKVNASAIGYGYPKYKAPPYLTMEADDFYSIQPISVVKNALTQLPIEPAVLATDRVMLVGREVVQAFVDQALDKSQDQHLAQLLEQISIS